MKRTKNHLEFYKNLCTLSDFTVSTSLRSKLFTCIGMFLQTAARQTFSFQLPWKPSSLEEHETRSLNVCPRKWNPRDTSDVRGEAEARCRLGSCL